MGRKKDKDTPELFAGAFDADDDGDAPYRNEPEDVAHARRHDPQTSHAAAASLSPDSLRKSQQEVLKVLVLFGPMTDEEILDKTRVFMPVSPSGCRTRRSELVEKGFVVDSGERKKLVSGRMSIVWKAKDA